MKFFASSLLGFFILFWLITPGVTSLRWTHWDQSAFMEADGVQAIEFVPLEDISPQLVRAVLLAEDDLFFEHSGFRLESLKKALAYNWKKKKWARGASTITQQLAKNLFFGKERSLWRKFNEAFVTIKMESLLSKRRILELYLNYAEMGPKIYGVKRASRYHFGKSPKHLTAVDAALLAATLPSGKIYGRKPYRGSTIKRQKRILYRMKHYALNVPVEFQKQYKVHIPSKQEKTIQDLIKDVNPKDMQDWFDREAVDSTEVFLDE